MAVPYTFGNATTSIPLSQLDSNFATAITLGNTSVQLGNTITNLTGVTNIASASSLTVGSNGNTTAIYVDTSQNVGIGTTSPISKFHVYSGQISVGGSAQGKLLGYSSGYAQIIDFGVSTGTGSGTDIGLYNVYSGGILGFGTNNTERMRIDSSGNLLVGTTTSVGKITQYGGQIVSGRLSNTTNYDASNGSINITSSGDGNPRGVITFGNGSTASQNWHFVSGESGASYGMVWYNGNYGSGTARMQLTTGGALSTTTGTISAISDVNFKENIIDAPNYLSLLNQVKVRKFSYKEENSATQTHIGVIAQELEQILPEMVFDQKDPVKETVHKTVRYTDFVLMLVKSIQELKAEFDAYKASHP